MKRQKWLAGILAVMVLASLMLAVVAFVAPASTQAGPPQPLYPCSGCGWREGYYCYDCRDGVLWECPEYWDHCWNPYTGEDWYEYCQCLISACWRLGYPC